MEDITKLAKSLKQAGLLIKGMSGTVKNEAQEQKCVFISMLLGTLGASVLGNLLACKEVKAKTLGVGLTKAGEGIIRVGQNF